MRSNTDAELLQEYSSGRSESAFGEIVRRYADLVYSAALRQVGDEEQARDVAQTVFLDLARKAGSLRKDTLLIGWLFRGTRLAALQQLRTDRRRLQRERHAMEWIDHSTDAAVDWTALRPVLDEAMGSLAAEDRDALLLRFFKNEPLVRVGTTLGVSEDAAQKRVSRALGKLREFLAGRGITTTSTALSASLAANAIQPAPAGLAAWLSTGALAKAAVAAGSATPLVKLFTLSNMKAAILVLALASGIAALTVSRVSAERQLRDARATVQQQTAELEELRAANNDLANQSNELSQLRDRNQELLKLRGEVATLRREQAAMRVPGTQLNTTSTPTPAETHTNIPGPDIMIKSKLVSISTEALKATSQMGMPAMRSGTIFILNEQQFKTINEALDGASDADVLGRPALVTRSGVQGSLAITGTALKGDTTAPVPNMSVDILPELNGSVLSLNVTAKLKLVADPEHPPRESVEQMTTELNFSSVVIPGQTVVMVRDLPGAGWMPIGTTNSSPEPRTLLVFVTPTIAPAGQFVDRLQTKIHRIESQPPQNNATRSE